MLLCSLAARDGGAKAHSSALAKNRGAMRTKRHRHRKPICCLAGRGCGAKASSSALVQRSQEPLLLPFTESDGAMRTKRRGRRGLRCSRTAERRRRGGRQLRARKVLPRAASAAAHRERWAMRTKRRNRRRPLCSLAAREDGAEADSSALAHHEPLRLPLRERQGGAVKVSDATAAAPAAVYFMAA
jgi:hypothetical protein